MMSLKLIVLTTLPLLTTAHYSLTYPSWRGDSFEEPASQYTFPCANVNATSSTNTTDWPLTGGSIILHLHHPWTYIWLNLGLGSNVTAFNISLTPNLPYNSTGNGTLCLPEVSVPEGSGVYEGARGSLQVVTVGDSGTALYNCADLRFTSEAVPLVAGEGECVTSPGITVERLEEQGNGTAASDGEDSETSGAAAETSSSAASSLARGSEGLGLPAALFMALTASVFGAGLVFL